MNAAISTTPSRDTIEQLEQDILRTCVGINAFTYELLVQIRQFEELGGHMKWGFDDCVGWLAWRCDFSTGTAREKLRVARALRVLPLVSEKFRTGELSYTKVRELTRVANPSNEDEFVTFALQHTSAQVTERCFELRMGQPDSLSVAERAFANRSLRISRNANRGMMTVTVELPLEAGELIEKALDKARDDVALQHPDIMDTTWSKRQADAFVTMVKSFLCGDNENQFWDQYLVNVHVDQRALAGEVGRSSLPIETVKRLACDSPVVTIVEDDKGQPLAVGRKSRSATTAQRRAIHARDNHTCRFPGCKNKRFVDIHHVDHWAHGGETDIDKMLLLCTRHHTLVHEGGFRIEKNYKDEWYFVRPDGIAVPEVGYNTQDMIDADIGGTPGEDYDPPRGALLSMAEKLVLEPPSPAYFY